MNNVLRNKNKTFIGILFIVSAAAFLIGKVAVPGYEPGDMINDRFFISNLFFLLSWALFSVSFFTQKKICLVISFLAQTAACITKALKIFEFFSKNDQFSKEASYAAFKSKQETIAIALIIAGIAAAAAAARAISANADTISKIAVSLLSAAHFFLLYYENDWQFFSVSPIGYVFDIVNVVAFAAALIIAYFVSKQLTSLERSVPADPLQERLSEVKRQYDSGQISEEEFKQKKAEILKDL